MSRFGGRARRVLALAVLIGMVVPISRVSAGSDARPLQFADVAGIHVVSVTPFDSRDINVRVLSASLG
ncbi:MAG TPA: hypothetical protein VNY84_00950, partial [Acidimicrobiales bacterium]|nr:hypothetical protein [Acidimicrobiales bacterium]